MDMFRNFIERQRVVQIGIDVLERFLHAVRHLPGERRQVEDVRRILFKAGNAFPERLALRNPTGTGNAVFLQGILGAVRLHGQPYGHSRQSLLKGAGIRIAPGGDLTDAGLVTVHEFAWYMKKDVREGQQLHGDILRHREALLACIKGGAHAGEKA